MVQESGFAADGRNRKPAAMLRTDEIQKITLYCGHAPPGVEWSPPDAPPFVHAADPVDFFVYLLENGVGVVQCAIENFRRHVVQVGTHLHAAAYGLESVEIGVEVQHLNEPAPLADADSRFQEFAHLAPDGIPGVEA